MFLKSDDKENYYPEFHSYLNMKEADNIVSFLKEKLLPNWPVAEWGELKDNPNSIGILTTEYAQVHSYICIKQFCSLHLYVGTLYSLMYDERKANKYICRHRFKCTRYVHSLLCIAFFSVFLTCIANGLLL